MIDNDMHNDKCQISVIENTNDLFIEEIDLEM